MDQLTELHCHILPYVDDGAQNLEEANELLLLQQEQGVTTIVATPHRRTHMFETPQEDVCRQFERLKEFAAQMTPPIQLLFGCENFCDTALEQRLREQSVVCMGDSSFVLIEFSGRHSAKELLAYTSLAVSEGYRPVIAHAERYPCVQENSELLEALIDAGAWIQINAGSVLGEDGLRQKWLCGRLMKQNLVHLIASDCHHMDMRRPNLGTCAAYVERKMGKAYAERIFYENPALILSWKTGE